MNAETQSWQKYFDDRKFLKNVDVISSPIIDFI